MYKTLPIKIKLTLEQKTFWSEQCHHALSLYNSALYLVKQQHYKRLEEDRAFNLYWRGDDLKWGWKTRKILGIAYPTLDKLLKQNKHYAGIAAQAAQQVLKVLDQDIKSYNRLVDGFFDGKVDRPRIPRYKKHGGLSSLTFPTLQLTFLDGRVKLPVCKSAKNSMICSTWIDVPDFLQPDKIAQIRVRPSRGEWWIDWILDDGKQEIVHNPNLNYNHALSIDGYP